MTYYEVLGIRKNASIDEIKCAFKAMAKKYHPDLNQAQNSKDMFIIIFEAYEILKEPSKRAIYDESISQNSNYSSSRKDFSNTEKREESEYEKYRQEARSHAQEYSEQDWQTFYNSFISKLVEVGKTTALVTAHVGLSVIEGLVRQTVAIFIVLLPIGLLLFGSLSYFKYTHAKKHAKIIEQRNIEFKNIIDDRDSFLAKFPMQNLKYNLKDKKVVFIDEDKNDFAECFFSLPLHNRPKDKNEVDYVIKIKRSDIVVGSYSDGNHGYKTIYFLSIIDYKEKIQVSEQVFKGSDPPNAKKNKGPAYGSNPLIDVEKIVKSQL